MSNRINEEGFNFVVGLAGSAINKRKKGPDDRVQVAVAGKVGQGVPQSDDRFRPPLPKKVKFFDTASTIQSGSSPEQADGSSDLEETHWVDRTAFAFNEADGLTDITEALLPQLPRHLKTIRLMFGKAPTITPNGFNELHRFPRLTNLSLEGSASFGINETQNLFQDLLLPFRLKSLTLRNWHFLNVGKMQFLEHLPFLEELVLSNVASLDASDFMVIIAQLPSLTRLSLEGYSEYSPMVLKQVIHHRPLYHSKPLLSLRLDNERITDNYLDVIATCPTFENLEFEGCFISDTGVLSLHQIKELKTLKIIDCFNVTQAGVDRLLRLRPNLRVTYKPAQ